MMAKQEDNFNPCFDFSHEWEEIYYGWECKKCHQFYAFGCEPWLYPDEELFDEFVNEDLLDDWDFDPIGEEQED